MRKICASILTVTLFSMASLAKLSTESLRRSHHLMPVPASIELQEGRLSLTSLFGVAIKGSSDTRLGAAIDRMSRRLEGRTGFTFPRGFSGDDSKATLLIECEGPGKTVPSLDEDESYSLTVDATRAVLKAATVVGVMRGLETFLQLLEGDREGYYFPAVSIQDKPRFSWRGLLIDACRHWQPVEVIKRNLDGMAAVKLNVLHWHLSEDQGFRVESKKYPKLHQMGSDGLFYTQDQIREVVAYARDRGIRVVPEFDMPGHVTAWLVGHPELASGPGPFEIARGFGVFDPSFDPTREEVYKFIDRFVGEMSGLFPDSYFHIGGDENNGKSWSKNEKIQEFMKKKGIADNHALQTYFNQRLLGILTKHHKKMVGWDEIFHPDLPKDIVVQSWRGQASLAEGARKGYTGILSNGYYLDHMLSAAKHYAVDPVPSGSTLDAEQSRLVLGGEACMWGEYVSPETIDSRIWPRLAAIAERFWSPRSVTDVDDMYRRLEHISVELEELGLLHEKNISMMLRRLAGGADVAALRSLIDVVEPVKEYSRGRVFPTTQMTPLTRLVDAARPESLESRRFARVVAEFLADAPRFSVRREELKTMLARWRDMEPAFEASADRSPVIREAAQLARDLSAAGEAGIEAIAYLTTGVVPPAEWRERMPALLQRCSVPRAEVELAIVPPLRLLINAALRANEVRTVTSSLSGNRADDSSH